MLLDSWKILSGIIATTVCYQTYVNLPIRVLYGSEIQPLPNYQSDNVVIIFPGFSGPDENVQRIQKEIENSDDRKKRDSFVTIYDWTAWKGNTLRAAFNSKIVGKAIGRQLSQSRIPIKELHVIGISVGAFAADSCIEEYKQQVAKSEIPAATTKLTLLDPFTSLGIFGQGYGRKYFGKSSDYCELFLNTDDPVPFTNEPLPFAMNFDITNCKDRLKYRPPEGDSMHSWPAAFYGLNWKKKINPLIKNPYFTANHQDNPRGSVRQLN